MHNCKLYKTLAKMGMLIINKYNLLKLRTFFNTPTQILILTKSPYKGEKKDINTLKKTKTNGQEILK